MIQKDAYRCVRSFTSEVVIHTCEEVATPLPDIKGTTSCTRKLVKYMWMGYMPFALNHEPILKKVRKNIKFKFALKMAYANAKACLLVTNVVSLLKITFIYVVRSKNFLRRTDRHWSSRSYTQIKVVAINTTVKKSRHSTRLKPMTSEL